MIKRELIGLVRGRSSNLLLLYESAIMLPWFQVNEHLNYYSHILTSILAYVMKVLDENSSSSQNKTSVR